VFNINVGLHGKVTASWHKTTGDTDSGSIIHIFMCRPKAPWDLGQDATRVSVNHNGVDLFVWPDSTSVSTVYRGYQEFIYLRNS